MRTRAVLVSIQALSAELLASAVCCSSLAKREFGSATGRPVTPALKAKTLGTKANASRAVASPAINRHFNPCPPRRIQNRDRLTLPSNDGCTEIETIYRSDQVLLLLLRI